MRIRTFSILPLKSGFSVSHIPLNKTTLLSAIRWIYYKFPIEAQEHESEWINFVNTVDDDRAKWATLFKFEDYETRDRRFDFSITTNGYSASLHLCRQKIAENEEETEEEQQQRQAESRRHILDGTYQRVVACDPGEKNLFVGRCSDEPGNPNAERSYVKATTGDYRQASQMIAQRKWHENLRKRCPEYDAKLKQVPSLHVTDPYVFMENAMKILDMRDFMFDFVRNHGFSKWKFKVRRFSEKALVKIAKKITKKLPKDEILVAYWRLEPSGRPIERQSQCSR